MKSRPSLQLAPEAQPRGRASHRIYTSTCSGLAHGNTRGVWYLKGGQVERGEAVEEAQTLNGHLDRALRVALPGAGSAGLRDAAVEEDAVQHVQDAREVCGLKGRRQACGILAITVKYAAGPAKEESALQPSCKDAGIFYRVNGTGQAGRPRQSRGALQ